MSTSRPIVTALISVYNGQDFIRQAVQSVFAQTMSDWELVVVDDGSTDGSLAILTEMAATEPRMKVISRPNSGICQALNDGLKIAQGEYIAKLDADDLAEPDRFARQLAFLKTHPDVVLVGGAWRMIDEAGRYLTTLNGPLDNAAIQQLALRGHAAVTHSCAMMRRSALDAIGGYDTYFKTNIDHDMLLRIGEVGRLANLPQVVGSYRLHKTSISQNKRHEQRAMAREACERAWRRRGIQGTFDAVEPWRPGKDRTSRHDFALQYGWWALGSQQRRTAMVYGIRAVAAKPWEIGGYKLLVLALFKPPRPVNT
jgi:glycosyltransferase involved in cell wall biosynthesis